MIGFNAENGVKKVCGDNIGTKGRWYIPYMVKDGEETHCSPLELGLAYEEAMRFNAEYSPSECGVKVFTKDVLKIINWKAGKCKYLHGIYLYTLRIK